MYNKLRLHAAILSYSESLTSSFARSNPLRSNLLVLNVNNGGLWNPKPALKKTAFGQNSKLKILPVRCQARFQSLKEKGGGFFFITVPF